MLKMTMHWLSAAVVLSCVRILPLPFETTASGAILTVNFDGSESWDNLGSPLNTIAFLDLAALAGGSPVTAYQINGIGWEGSIQTFDVGDLGGSWVGEAAIAFNNDFILRPGNEIDEPSYENPPDPDHVSTGGIIDLRAIGQDPIQVLAADLLSVEFFETFDDESNARDSIHVTGELFLDVSVLNPPSQIMRLTMNSMGSPRWHRPSGLDSLSEDGTDTPYDELYLIVDTTGDYVFSGLQEDFDGVMMLYEAHFDATHPLWNIIEYNDDGPEGIGTSEIAVPLSADENYFLITTGFGNGDFGGYTVDVYGPEGAHLMIIPEPSGIGLALSASFALLAGLIQPIRVGSGVGHREKWENIQTKSLFARDP